MNLKMNLTYLSLLIGMVMFSNQAIYAQKGSAIIIRADATTDFLKRSVPDISQNDLCLGLTTNQLSYQSHPETRDEKSEFIAMNRKYYRKDAEINKISPVVLNSSFGFNAFPKAPSKHLETREFYLHRSKNQNTAGWILVGAGTTMILIPPIAYWNYSDWGPSGGDIAMTMMVAGLISDFIGIGFFISAHHYKKLASSLSFENQHIYSPLDRSLCQSAVPSLTLRIKL